MSTEQQDRLDDQRHAAEERERDRIDKVKRLNAASEALASALADKVAEPFEVGDVIRWVSAGRFTYVAVRTPAGWYTSAGTASGFFPKVLDTYEDLVEALNSPNVTDIEVAATWVKVQ